MIGARHVPRHMPQTPLEHAVIEALARKFDASAVTATIDRALELFEEERRTATERRKSIEEAVMSENSAYGYAA